MNQQEYDCGLPHDFEKFEVYMQNYGRHMDEVLEYSKVVELDRSGEADSHRWQTWQEQYYKHIPSGRYFAVMTCHGNTESQDGEDTEYMHEVIPVEVTRIEYKQKV